jgi:hypothetical protein
MNQLTSLFCLLLAAGSLNAAEERGAADIGRDGNAHVEDLKHTF